MTPRWPTPAPIPVCSRLATGASPLCGACTPGLACWSGPSCWWLFLPAFSMCGHPSSKPGRTAICFGLTAWATRCLWSSRSPWPVSTWVPHCRCPACVRHQSPAAPRGSFSRIHPWAKANDWRSSSIPCGTRPRTNHRVWHQWRPAVSHLVQQIAPPVAARGEWPDLQRTGGILALGGGAGRIVPVDLATGATPTLDASVAPKALAGPPCTLGLVAAAGAPVSLGIRSDLVALCRGQHQRAAPGMGLGYSYPQDCAAQLGGAGRLPRPQ